MNSILVAVSLFLGTPAAALQQEGWSETSFHRIYLRNGNFIDGRVISDKPNEVILLLKSGEMGIRRDQIDRVELVKMKSWNEKNIVLTPPTNPTSTNPTANPNNVATPVVDTPEAVRKKVDMIVFRYKNTRKTPEDTIPWQEIKALGEEAVVYLAANSPKFDLQTQDAISVALIQLKPTPKVVEVLEKLLSHENPRCRALGLSVLTAEATEENKAKYATPLLRDADGRVRLAALSALGSTQDKSVFGAVTDLIADPENEVRSRAIRIAKNLAEKHGMKEDLARIVTPLVSSSSAAVRIDAVGSIGFLGMPALWKEVVPALSDSEPTVRAAAAQTLMTLAAPESGEAIASALSKEDDRWTRIYLAGAAQKIRPPAAVEPLIRWLSEPDEELRKLAGVTLQGITGQNFGSDKERWEVWWQANRK
jgi:HEAT repeat protein